MNAVETVRSTILNRMSHSGVPTLVAKEVQFALDSVKKLQQHPSTRVQAREDCTRLRDQTLVGTAEEVG